jgi:hypothetical protein
MQIDGHLLSRLPGTLHRKRLLLGVPPSGGRAFSRLKPGLRTSSSGSKAQGAHKVRGILSSTRNGGEGWGEEAPIKMNSK